ncbi:MAG: FG-GAP repeat domain-containing protein [Phycisphaerales bacterium JB038]
MGLIGKLGVAAVVLWWSGAVTSAQCLGPLFPEEVVGPADLWGRDLAAADLDGDGADDLAITSYGELWIYLSDGAGGFPTCERLTGLGGDAFPGGVGLNVGAGDVDGDGDPDLLVTAETSPGTLYIALNQGDGSFQNGGALAFAPAPGRPTCVDLNGDGALDVVFPASGQLGVVLNDGSGAFSTPEFYSVPSLAWSLVASDYDEDGNIDLALFRNTGPPEIYLLLGAGDGAFSVGPSTTLDGDAEPPLVGGDFNEDGHADLVCLLDVGAGYLQLYLGQGDGSFVLSGFPQSPAGPSALRVADFDSDAHLDIATAASGNFESKFAINFGAGDGTFDLGPDILLDRDPGRLVSGDFDGDGALDIAADGAHKFTIVALNGGDGSFTTSRYSQLDGYVQSFDLGDLDGDFDVDLVVGTKEYDADDAELAVYLNQGSGGFTAAWSLPLAHDFKSVRLANLNGDGIPDLVALDSYVTLYVLLGSDAGTYFGTPTSYHYGSSQFNQQLGDLNGDGLDDMVVRLGDAGHIAIVLNAGDGDFSTISSTIDTADAPWALFDADADGDLDLFLSNGQTTVSIALNDGAGAFADPIVSSIAGFNAGVVSAACGDLDGDGNMDVVLGGFYEDPYTYDIFHYICVVRGQGDGTFLPEPRQ